MQGYLLKIKLLSSRPLKTESKSKETNLNLLKKHCLWNATKLEWLAMEPMTSLPSRKQISALASAIVILAMLPTSPFKNCSPLITSSGKLNAAREMPSKLSDTSPSAASLQSLFSLSWRLRPSSSVLFNSYSLAYQKQLLFQLLSPFPDPHRTKPSTFQVQIFYNSRISSLSGVM